MAGIFPILALKYFSIAVYSLHFLPLFLCFSIFSTLGLFKLLLHLLKASFIFYFSLLCLFCMISASFYSFFVYLLVFHLMKVQVRETFMFLGRLINRNEILFQKAIVLSRLKLKMYLPPNFLLKIISLLRINSSLDPYISIWKTELDL